MLNTSHNTDLSAPVGRIFLGRLMDLFKQRAQDVLCRRAPLADRMRPRTLDEFVGQDHIVGPGRLLRRAIQIDQLSSLIFYGPPGTGKTTLARIIANTTRAQFLTINAVLAGVKEIREAVDSARNMLELHGRRTILFIDEVHRFNKAQQDALLPHVENGLLILIGATTENPYFEVNKALVSRSRIFQLHKLTRENLVQVARQALADPERGYGKLKVTVDDEALEHLVDVANGDARGVLNALELAVETTPVDCSGAIRITRAIAEESIQQRAVLYDKDGDAHYDTVSAFIKSLRGSDPDAALYWMARMVYAGEDPRFIFRRMAIFACEDIGMADPQALIAVMSAAQAFDFVGMPEGRYHLAYACLYCATAPKSNSAMAFFDALDVVGREMEQEVPKHLMDSSRDSEGLGHGQGYLYPHAYRDHWVAQQYLPESLQGRIFYQPSEQGAERELRERVLRLREAQVEAMVSGGGEELLDGTSQPRSRAASQWALRATGRTGELLARVRDRLLDMAGVSRDSMVLDLYARTGLLTFEAARRVKHGAVWALAHDERSYTTVQGMARTLNALERPQVVRVTWEGFDTELLSAAGTNVRFSAIVGRNALALMPTRVQILRRAASLLAEKGIMALVETLPWRGQRLSSLCDLSSLPPVLRDGMLDVENALFTVHESPADCWEPENLVAELTRIGLQAECALSEEYAVRRLTLAEIDYWFREPAAGERRSLGKLLRDRLGGEGTKRIQNLLQAQLAEREVRWKTTVAYIRVWR